MTKRHVDAVFRLLCAAAALCLPAQAPATEIRGVVTFNGLPVPGATVIVAQGATKQSAVTDQNGEYTFGNLADGEWKIEIAMDGFAELRADLTVTPKMLPGKWELTLLPLDKLLAMSRVAPPSPPQPTLQVQKPANTSETQSNAPPTEFPKPESDANRQSDDGFLVNGSVNNAATSMYALEQAFGNRRPGSHSLYNGGFAAILNNSALDAQPYSLSGIASPKPAYDRITGVATVGGPMKIPHLMPSGPTFFSAYEWTRDHDAVTETGLVPTAAERTGDLSGLLNAHGQPVTIYNPATGLPIQNNVVPVSAQAKALLRLYPLPNIAGELPYNYQIPVLNSIHQDVVQLRMDKTLGHRDQVYGRFNLQSTRAADANLFSFVDTTDVLGINSSIHWSHRFNARMFLFAGYTFSRLRTLIRPQFENRENISGEAGIAGNDQDPSDWGPPALNFSSGISALSDAESAFNRNRTDSLSLSASIYRRSHFISAGVDLRNQQFNELFQQDPRGTFTFTGAATSGASQEIATAGSDLADFLIGVPDASSIAFGNADKYLREPVYDAYLADDWRVQPDLTINIGLRWEYGAPMTELHGRLVNLDIASGFTSVAPVLGSDPVGPLTGRRYSASLIRPDRKGIEPRVGISWRPIAASSFVVRAGYGIYRDTSVYLDPVLQMAQQAPLSKSVSVQNSASCPLILADGFISCAGITPDTFAIDPNFRVGYAQSWNLELQRDLPGALQVNITYLGLKGTHGVQEFLPNTYPIGAVDPCPSCPSGFAYRTSGGDSTRESGQLELRRRLRSGFTATAVYTFSKSVDDDAFLGGEGYVSSSQQGENMMQIAPTLPAAIAQNWLDPKAERSLSTFDQRHLLSVVAQYTTGEGLHGGDLTNGWAGRLLKEWTVTGQLTAGSGMPETPIYPAAVPGAGYTGIIRPNRTRAPLYISGGNAHLNQAAFTPPSPGRWGTAGRDSITGPRQFSLNSSLARTFRPGGKLFLDARIDITNVLNHAEFTTWNTTVNSAQFGLPMAASAMRSLQTTVRLRF